MRSFLYEKIKTRVAGLVGGLLIVVSNVYPLFGGFLDNSTLFLGGKTSTSISQGNEVDLESNYEYNIGIRKIALFPYQDRDRFYRGDEESLSDKAIIGAVNNWEYLFNVSSVRNQGLEYIDQEYWFKWSNNWFVTKTKYVDKESRDLEFFDFDARFRMRKGKFNFTVGGALRAHPVYGYSAIDDYEGYWWDLAYNYGYQDFMIPEVDLNENGIIDQYYVWIETDPETLEGYWILFYEGTNYYWENPDGEYVAGSDDEFYQYHLSDIIQMYNEDNKIEEWQSELHLVVGFDMLFGNEEFYSHLWVNVFPKSYGLTDNSYGGEDMQYDIGVIVGTNLSEHIGVYIEGNYLNYYGKEEHNVMAGLNWRF